MCENLYMI